MAARMNPLALAAAIWLCLIVLMLVICYGGRKKENENA
jgi:hypothetical protein